MRRAIAIIMLFLPLSLYAAVLPGYDFTFFKTITDSLMAADSEKLGIDLTGYGFIGSTITSGIYLRFGIQSPYTTIWSLFKNGKTDSQEEIDIPISGEITPEDADRSKSNEYRLSLTLGPAFRHMISDEAIWYMGLGVSASIHHTLLFADSERTEKTTDTKLGIDFDMGFRLDAQKKNTTIRIGVQGSMNLIKLENMQETYRNEKVHDSTSLVANMFLPDGRRENGVFQGYISLGHTYKQRGKGIRYRYIITGPELFSGKTELMQ
ncbi:MAG: hypothetical protein SPJ34_04690 [Candidatus Ornithospirochaeta sp.]|nr:hypothetical protein [Candidatus Ornithospirochaeta sp.]